jgi:hypothetical protein
MGSGLAVVVPMLSPARNTAPTRIARAREVKARIDREPFARGEGSVVISTGYLIKSSFESWLTAALVKQQRFAAR